MLELLLNIIGTILYPLFNIIFVLINLFQSIFRGFAGVEDVHYGAEMGFSSEVISGGNANNNTGELKNTGIVYYLLQSDLVKNMFFSMVILGLFLIIMFTFIATIKNVYSSKPKPWQELAGKAMIGLVNFIIVPILCLFGVWIGNILLDAIDGATSNGEATSMANKLFLVSAYNANKYRSENLNQTETGDPAVAKEVYNWAYNKTVNLSGNETNAELANIVDDCYANNYYMISGQDMVQLGYSLGRINYLLLLVGGIFMLWVLVSISYAMIRRLFVLLMLYIISPIMCAMYPWDDGKALGNWRSNFVKNVISAYGAVAGMNLFFSILPLVENIKVGFTGYNNSIVKLIVIVCGLFAMKEFIGTISTLIGGEDAVAQGAQLRSQASGAIQKRLKVAGGVAVTGALAAGAAKKAKSVGEDGNKAFWGSIGNSISDKFGSAAKEKTGIDIKGMRDSYKKGGDEYQTRADKEAKKQEKKDKAAASQKGIKAYEADKASGVEDGYFMASQIFDQNEGGLSKKGFKKRDDGRIEDEFGNLVKGEDLFGQLAANQKKRTLRNIAGEGDAPKTEWGKKLFEEQFKDLAKKVGMKGGLSEASTAYDRDQNKRETRSAERTAEKKRSAEKAADTAAAKADAEQVRKMEAVSSGVRLSDELEVARIRARDVAMETVTGYGVDGAYSSGAMNAMSKGLESGEVKIDSNGKVTFDSSLTAGMSAELADEFKRMAQDTSDILASELKAGNNELERSLEQVADVSDGFTKQAQEIVRKLGLAASEIDKVMAVISGKSTATDATSTMIKNLINEANSRGI